MDITKPKRSGRPPRATPAFVTSIHMDVTLRDEVEAIRLQDGRSFNNCLCWLLTLGAATWRGRQPARLEEPNAATA